MTPYQVRMLYGPDEDLSDLQWIELPPEAAVKMMSRRKQKKLMRRFGAR